MVFKHAHEFLDTFSSRTGLVLFLLSVAVLCDNPTTEQNLAEMRHLVSKDRLPKSSKHYPHFFLSPLWGKPADSIKLIRQLDGMIQCQGTEAPSKQPQEMALPAKGPVGEATHSSLQMPASCLQPHARAFWLSSWGFPHAQTL